MRDTPKTALPYFWEVAQARLEDSPKTVHVNVARLTCEMMIEREQRELTAYRECVEALTGYLQHYDSPERSAEVGAWLDREGIPAMRRAVAHAQGTG